MILSQNTLSREPNVSKGISYLIGFSTVLIIFAFDGDFNMQVLFPVILILAAWYAIKQDGNILINTNLVIVSAIVGVLSLGMLSNLILSPEIINGDSIVRYFYSIVILIFYWLLCSSNFSKLAVRRLLWANVASGLFIAGMIILNWRNGAQGKISVITVFGTQVEENYTGSLLAFLTVLTLIIIFLDKRFVRRAIYFVVFLIELLGVSLTGCRAAMIALSASIFIIVFQRLFLQRKISIVKKISSLIVIACAFIFIWTHAADILPSFIYNRLFVNGLNDSSNSQRVLFWTFGLSHIMNRPLLGFGVGNFNYYVVKQFALFSTSVSGVVVAHNTYIDSLLDCGFLGTGLYCWLILRNIRAIFTLKNAILMALFACVFITALIVGGERTVFFWYGCAITSILSRFAEREQLTTIFENDNFARIPR